MKTKLIGWTPVLLLLSAFALGLPAQTQRDNIKTRLDTEAGSPVIAKLREIVAIRKRLFESQEGLLQAGRAPLGGMEEIELAEARLELARELKSGEAAALQEIVDAHARRLRSLESIAPDRLAPGELDRARVALLEAEVRVLRARN